MTKFKLGTGNARGAPKSATMSMFVASNNSASKAIHGNTISAMFLGAPTAAVGMSASKGFAT